MTNKYEEFRKHFEVKVDSLAEQDFELDDNGYPVYSNTNVYGDTLRIYLRSIETGEDLLEIDSTDDINIINSFVNLFQSFGFNEDSFLDKLKSLHQSDGEFVFYY